MALFEDTGGLWSWVGGQAGELWDWAKDIGASVIEKKLIGEPERAPAPVYAPPPTYPAAPSPSQPLVTYMPPMYQTIDPQDWSMGGPEYPYQQMGPPAVPAPAPAMDIKTLAPLLIIGGLLFMGKGR